ncbi:oxidoreductase [Chromatiales bacterium (ex Bugula neritina AB1)]|nr:oxidoreductase [Chromatiales bacterium (ex Bugula neritina AB1)]
MTTRPLKKLDRTIAARHWHPIATSEELPLRHVYHGQILGRELAVWRADDGNVNVWENRCLHRGVRLSIGINDGQELACQYHGWRYSNRTAGCTYIPAHPADAPARTICNNTYPVSERYGLVWTTEAATDTTVPAVPELEIQNANQSSLVLRSIPVNAPLAVTAEYFSRYSFSKPVNPSVNPPAEIAPTVTRVIREEPYQITVLWSDGHGDSTLVFFLQPVDSHRTRVHAVLTGPQLAAEPLLHLKTHNFAMSHWRNQIESSLTTTEMPEPFQVTLPRVTEALAAMPEPASSGRRAPLRVVVEKIHTGASDIKAFELVSIDAQLPTFQAGAHIDVHLANSQIKQYSLTNAPVQTDRYIIAVKREANGAGGSAFLHDSVRIGDTLAISEPRNNFPLRRDAVNTLLIAGGIGITPLLAMAQALQNSERNWHLHYFVQRETDTLFPELLTTLGNRVTINAGFTPEQTRASLNSLLENYTAASHVYLCGPAPMLNAARDLAQQHNWPDKAVHFEFFKNTSTVTSENSFRVDLARSGLTLTVEAGQTLLQTLRSNGVDLPSSCEQGACGTCRVAVLDGQPLHQDVYLNDTERQSNNCIMTCVSRAVSERLVLDI